MAHLSKRKGAISVFLLIIFMVTYVFMGLLVDAARYKMAQAYAEAALDNACNSVLSNYNQLVYDLYGVFCVDIPAEEKDIQNKVQELCNKYLEDSLGIAGVFDASEYKTMLSKFIDGSLNESTDKSVLTTKSMYDFSVTEISAGTDITLADTSNFENQIIEYMKFRAPVELLEDTRGFLDKLNAIVEMKNRVAEAIEKEKIKEKYESDKDGNTPLSSETKELINDSNTFATRLYNYSLDPGKAYEDLSVTPTYSNNVYNNNPKKVREYAENFDNTLASAETAYNAEMEEIDKEYAGELCNAMEKLQKGYKEAVEAAREEQTVRELKVDEDTLITEINIQALREEMSLLDIEALTDMLIIQTNGRTETWCTTYQNEHMGAIQKRDDRKSLYYSDTYIPELKKANDTLQGQMENMKNNATVLYGQAQDLVTRIDEVYKRYNSYISELKARQNNEEAKASEGTLATIYATEIELAEANAGEVIKNIEILAGARKQLDGIANGIVTTSGTRSIFSDDIANLADAIVGVFKESPGNNQDTQPLMSMLPTEDNYEEGNNLKDLYLKDFAVASITYVADAARRVEQTLPEIQNYISCIYSSASYYHTTHYRADVDVIIEDAEGNKEKSPEELVKDGVKTEDAEAKASEEIKKSEKSSVKLDSDKICEHPELLKVNYSNKAAVAEGGLNDTYELEGEVTASTVKNLLSAGLAFIEGVTNLLENARDNLYVDAYVMSMLPNYKEHYKEYDDNKLKSDILAAPRGEYLASYAEVEYVITGGGKGALEDNGALFEKEKEERDGQEVEIYKNSMGELSVAGMRAKLFGTRLILNSLSMLTDSAKMSQASVLSAWAGPFAPLVSVLLVICWIIAESTIDVMVLMGDMKLENGEVALVKKSQDWLFSLEGAVEGLAELAVDKIAKGILNMADNLTAAAEMKANGMIYKAYDAASKGIGDAKQAVDTALNAGQEAFFGWETELKENIKKAGEEKSGVPLTEETTEWMEGINISATFKDTVQREQDSIFNAVSTVTDDIKEKAVMTVSRVGDSVMKATKSYVDEAGKTTKEFISKNISKVVPIGTVVNGAKAEVTMNYREYLYFYLFIMEHETKLQRIQSVVQANCNMKNEADKFVLLEKLPVSVWADLELSMKYMFLSNSVVPESMRKNGRLRFKVISAQSY